MSSNFLQRFKGKTQTISKDGVHNVLGGGKGNDVVVYTNTTSNMNQKANTSKTSNLNPSKNQDKQTKLPDRKNQSMNKLTSKNQIQKVKQIEQPKKQKPAENPFLCSNPFYLDEEERERQQKQRKQQERRQKLQRQMNKTKDDPKKGTYASLRNHSSQKKTDKEWTKLGGLGPNIGGQEWEQKKKKLDKMQEFAQQVKAINSQKNRPPRPQKREQKKDNARQKALQYSKNIPKPVIRQQRQQEYQQQPIKQINQNQMSQLQQYQLRHKQLKEMIRNQN